MYLFFDCEFSGLHKDTTLISIGIAAENGKRFYAEFSDYDMKQCNAWIKENVLKHTVLAGNPSLEKMLDADKNTTATIGSKIEIHHELDKWLEQFDRVQFVSDVCHYDFVLLIDLLTNSGTALDLSDNISAVCHDLNTDIACHYGISEKEAFEKSREDIVSELCGQQIEGNKHNALYDAEVIKAIYKEIA